MYDVVALGELPVDFMPDREEICTRLANYGQNQEKPKAEGTLVALMTCKWV